MTSAPPFKIKVGDEQVIQNGEDAVGCIKEALWPDLDHPPREGEAGWALARLFGRLADLVITRLNKAPEKHFLAFLNDAGIELLPARPANGEVSLTPAKDAPPVIRVPQGTQFATLQTKTNPEIIFETQRDVMVARNALLKGLALDPVMFSDCTAQLTGQAPVSPAGFPTFQGDQERARILYLGGDDLFKFPDNSTRLAAKITLNFSFVKPGRPQVDGWKLAWQYYDGTTWQALKDSGNPKNVDDGTAGFSQDGAVILTNLPAFFPTKQVDGKDGLWLACKLAGGTSRAHLPVVKAISVKRELESIDTLQNAVVDTAFCAGQSGTIYIPIDPGSEFYPLGLHPGRLDAFYLRSDEAFSKRIAKIAIQMTLQGVPAGTSSQELSSLQIAWDYYSSKGWANLGNYKMDSASPDDTTHALTSPGVFSHQFDPQNGLGFSPIKVNNQQGYWIRARVLAGSYDAPVQMSIPDVGKWVGTRTFAPMIESLSVGYTAYPVVLAAGRIACFSRKDEDQFDYTAAVSAGQPFAPFSTADEAPGLYLGFEQAFPAGEWMQLLCDVAEAGETEGAYPPVLWEYWSGDQWAGLRVADGTSGLQQRGFLGFFGPEDQPPAVKFGLSAFWLRARPQLPLANAGQAQAITIAWTANEATVHLDASKSSSIPGRNIKKYIWSTPQPKPVEPGPLNLMPHLKQIRINTVPVQNAFTLQNEVLGSSDGKPGQIFAFLRPPILADASMAVREPDRPPADELALLENELRQANAGTEALPAITTAPGDGVWVLWHRVPDFLNSAQDSRHFMLDPISGKVYFGDGQRGKIPPIGRDNILALHYSTHNGAAGNLGPGAISVVRNPGGDLAAIKSVTNPEATSGGSDAETVDGVKLRGPQNLKHRQRAITIEDYAWLAREATSEVACAYCLPTRNQLGLPEAGWVTVVITPQSPEARPEPSPTLIRGVKAYLEAHALANLSAARQILVKGPEYIRATVIAKVVAIAPEKADEVKLAVQQALGIFLHPLLGGPGRAGWELGRDVYLSEISAEIESVAGVEHLADLQLLGSLQQFRIQLLSKPIPLILLHNRPPYNAPVGSQVGTFDERKKLLLAEPILGQDAPQSIVVYGFKVGDLTDIVASDNTPLHESLEIASISAEKFTFTQLFVPPPGWDALISPANDQRPALISRDQRIRLPLSGDERDAAGNVSAVTVQGFELTDPVCVVAGYERDPRLEFLSITQIDPCQDRIFVPEGHLVYSGSHDIEMVLE